MYKLNNYPCIFLISSIIIVIFLLYFFNFFKTFICKKDLISSILSNFIHTDFFHLVSNVFSLFVLTQLEEKIGTKNFFILMFLILFVNSIFETLFYKFFNLPCSIGFSAIIYGIFAWEMTLGIKNFDYLLIISIIYQTILTITKNTKIAVINHIIGIISGVIIGKLFIADTRT